MTPEDVRRLLAQVLTCDASAVPALDRLIAELCVIRDRLNADDPGNRSEGGASDRVRMQVVGPDGTTKIDTDPGA